jgi:hypothetical protein
MEAMRKRLRKKKYTQNIFRMDTKGKIIDKHSFIAMPSDVANIAGIFNTPDGDLWLVDTIGNHAHNV